MVGDGVEVESGWENKGKKISQELVITEAMCWAWVSFTFMNVRKYSLRRFLNSPTMILFFF